MKLRTLAMTFPGQGSQSVGMVEVLSQKFPVVKQTFDQASSVLGYDLWQLVAEGPAEKMNQTTFTQPAMLTADIAFWRCWLHQEGVQPEWVAGHSLGEYAALVVAESLLFEDAIRVVAKRGELMQAAVKPGQGAMAAIVGLDDSVVAKLCEQVEGIVSPANYNSIGQVVVAGETAAVELVVADAKAAKARIAKIIPVSVPSHCELMDMATLEFTDTLINTNIATPNMNVIQNVDGKVHADVESIRKNLIDQLVKPVQWVATIQHFRERGVDMLFECGPGKVLTGLNRRIDGHAVCKAMSVAGFFDNEVIACQ